jgi:hypothetical protein
VFLGELEQKDGSKRLVCVDLVVGHDSDAPYPPLPAFDYHVIAPGSAFTRPRLCSNRWWRMQPGGGIMSALGVDQMGRIYVGARDPADASHLTIAFERGGKTKVIDGWLRSDESILFEERK